MWPLHFSSVRNQTGQATVYSNAIPQQEREGLELARNPGESLLTWSKASCLPAVVCYHLGVPTPALTESCFEYTSGVVTPSLLRETLASCFSVVPRRITSVLPQLSWRKLSCIQALIPCKQLARSEMALWMSRSRRMLWLTVSNAVLRSRTIKMELAPESADSSRSLVTLTWVLVGQVVLYLTDQDQDSWVVGRLGSD